MVKITVDRKKCDGCETCVQVCPVQIFKMSGGKSEVQKDKVKDCLECRACEAGCPQQAIKVQ